MKTLMGGAIVALLLLHFALTTHDVYRARL